MSNSSSGVSIRDIAKAVGLSKSTVGYALRNHPGVNRETKARVQRAAHELGYAPDARVSSVLAAVRGARTKSPLPIAWLNTTRSESSWRKFKYLSPYFEGAQARAAELGYYVEEFWAGEPRMSMRRISQILDRRGIEGVAVTYPARHVRLNWERLACVSIEGALLAPRLHRVVSDMHHNLLLALKMLKRGGYRRIGICLEKVVDPTTSIQAAAAYFQMAVPKIDRIPPLFYASDSPDDWAAAKKRIFAWLSRHRPEVVVGHTSRMAACVGEAGYRVPDEMGVVHLATDDDVADWAGIDSRKRDMGAAAVDLLTSLVQLRQFGLPRAPMDTLIRGAWHPGRTLLLPNPRR
ncbi:MAG: LacI family DNA-binding transcriptional regulator [Terrimicrobiaceae bacterium]